MIFYFSCTGNTRWAAHRLAQATQEQLVDIAKAVHTDCHYVLTGEERMGFCFPVHGWRPPRLVREFVSRLSVEQADGHYCYALCTAGDTVGEAMDLFEADLLSRGLAVQSRFSLLMPESYVGLPFMDTDPPRREAEKIEQAAGRLEQYAESIGHREQGLRLLDIGRWPRINSRLLGAFFLRHLVTDKPFRADQRLCTRCGACSRVCPVDNIEGGKGHYPTWLHNGRCLTCFACYHHCPAHAIAFGRRTQGKGQYHFPRPNGKP